MMVDEKCTINKGDHVKDDCGASSSTMHDALAVAHTICPLETATAVKKEPPDVSDGCCSTDAIANVKTEVSAVSDEVYFLEIDTAVKIEPLDVNEDVCSLGGNVKSVCSDVRDEVRPQDTAAMVKPEVDVGPTVQSPQIKKTLGRLLPLKPYSENKDENLIINKGDHVQEDCKASKPNAVSTLHNTLVHIVGPLETAIAVKKEPPDVNGNGCSKDIVNLKTEASTISDEVHFPEINIKIEPLDVNEDICSLDDGIGNVKSEGSEVRDEVCPLDTAAMVNLEVDIGPTVLQPQIKYKTRGRLLSCKLYLENNGSHSVSSPPLKPAPKKCKTQAERQREYRLRQKQKILNNPEERRKTLKSKIEYQRQYRLKKRIKKAQNHNGDKPPKKTRADYQREYRIRKKLRAELNSGSAEFIQR